MIGICIGIYVGIKVGEKDTPFGIFACLFGLRFAPFTFLTPDFLRFLLFSIIASLSFFLPCPSLYPAVSLILFGKYFGELACVVFLTDSILSMVLSVLVVYLPLLLVGGSMILFIALKAKNARIRCGASPCLRSVKNELWCLGGCLGIYFTLLFLIYVVVCGVIYLLLIAL